MRFFLDIHLDVAGHTVARTGIALSWYVDHHSVLHSGRDVYLHYLFALHDTGATASLTLVFDDLALAVTVRTFRLGLHHAEHGALCAVYDTAALTVAAGLRARSACASRAVATAALHVLSHLKLLGHARVDLFESELDFQSEVRTLVYTLSSGSTASAKASEASAEASVATEDVAKGREDVIHRESASTAESAAESAGARTVKSKLVILLALLFVREHGISLGSLLELLLSLFLLLFRLVALTVGVKFYCYLSVCFLYVGSAGLLVYAQHLIVVSLSHYKL